MTKAIWDERSALFPNAASVKRTKRIEAKSSFINFKPLLQVDLQSCANLAKSLNDFVFGDKFSEESKLHELRISGRHTDATYCSFARRLTASFFVRGRESACSLSCWSMKNVSWLFVNQNPLKRKDDPSSKIFQGLHWLNFFCIQKRFATKTQSIVNLNTLIFGTSSLFSDSCLKNKHLSAVDCRISRFFCDGLRM